MHSRQSFQKNRNQQTLPTQQHKATIQSAGAMGSDLGNSSKNAAHHRGGGGGRAVSQFFSTTSILSHLLVFVVGCGVAAFLLNPRGIGGGGGECDISYGKYHGREYSNEMAGTVGAPKCLVESKFLKVQQHHVQMPGSTDVIPDWLWIDYHDRINVVVEDPSSPGDAAVSAEERKFLVFEQSKYALEGRMSKAIVGGIIEPGEQPEDAARREVAEEMHVSCKEFHFLGRFRTDVNRGMGWTNCFLATECSKKLSGEAADANEIDVAEEVGAADTERQDLQTITHAELKQLAQQGKFLEIQWTATVSLALLHFEAA